MSFFLGNQPLEMSSPTEQVEILMKWALVFNASSVSNWRRITVSYTNETIEWRGIGIRNLTWKGLKPQYFVFRP